MDILSILQLFGGIGLFLYGMSQMSSSLEKLAGSGLERVLETLTTSKKKGVGLFKGWAFGTGVTGIMQSSAATTIMLIGFVNAGIMKVAQAIPVVFGANLGSTVTAQILRLGDIGSDNIILQLLKPATFACVLVGVGAFTIVFTKSKNAKNIAGIFVGLGMLFYGMSLMEKVFVPLQQSAYFRSLMTSFENPLIGILTGIIITAILQSSSASVGILQSLSATGTISCAVAIPIIVGQNIGKCSTTIIGGIGANKKGKRLVAGYVFFNIFGAVLLSSIVYILHYTLGLGFMSKIVNRGDIATIHLLFNLITSLVLLPFSEKVADLTGKIVRDDEDKETDLELAKLDDMLLNTPTIALQQCRNVIIKMSDAILDNYNLATSMVYEYDEAKFPIMEENEAFIDKCETVLSAYIVRIDRKRLSSDDKLLVTEILNSIGDFERIGDYCMTIAYTAKDKNEKEIHFSPTGHREVEDIIKAVKYTIETSFSSFREDDLSHAVRVEPLSEVINELKEILKSHHVERLQDGICSIEGGVSLFDMVNSFERIASHAANISLHVIKKVRRDLSFDEMHGHANDSHSEEYKALYHYYMSQYIEPIISSSGSDDADLNYVGDKIDKSKNSKKADKRPASEKQSKSNEGKAVNKDSKSVKENKTVKDSKTVKDIKTTKDSKSVKENKTTKDSKVDRQDKDDKHGGKKGKK